MRYLELLRHPDNDGDNLSPEGVAAAEEIGRTSLVRVPTWKASGPWIRTWSTPRPACSA